MSFLNQRQFGRRTLLGAASTVPLLGLATSAEVGQAAPLRQRGDEQFRPTRFSSLAQAKRSLNAPADANYVVWNHGTQHLEQVFASLQDNDILVLPERSTPYLIDSSKGFMALGVTAVDGTGPDGKKDGSRVPITSSQRLWFAMARSRRGILGLGPGAVIQPSESSFTAPRWPLLSQEPDKKMYRYMADGTKAEMVGSQCKLIECNIANPFFANFTLRSRSFGGVDYNGLSITKRDADPSSTCTIKRVHFDGCWRGHGGIPNGETAAITLQKGRYVIENCDLRSVAGSSPVMWNNTQGGTVHTVRSSRPDVGMWTFWRCGGVNRFTNIYLTSTETGLNLEENLAGFSLDWDRGVLNLESDETSRFHLNINPSGGSNRIALKDVTASPNGYTPNTLTAHVYTTGATQRRSDVTSNSQPVSYVPAERWID